MVSRATCPGISGIDRRRIEVSVNSRLRCNIGLFFALTTVVLLTVPCTASTGESGEGWIQLFNGRDLDGWTVKIAGYEVGENFGDTFRVEDGLLISTCEEYETFEDRFAHLFYDGTFSHYRVRVEYRIVGDQCPGAPEWGYRNSGIMVHGQSPESMEIDQWFPTSIEVQLLGGDGAGPQPNGNVCTPGTHIVVDGDLITEHCTQSSSATFDGDQWVTVEAEVRGDEVIRHFVNGELVLEYQSPQLDDGTPLSSGTISLQGESHRFEFRKVELLPLE
jgi:hypothetical protein